MARKHNRETIAPRLESLEERALLSVDGWQGYARDPQHTALSPVASDALQSIRWQTPVDLKPQYSGSDLLIHYGSPLVTAANTVLIPVKTGASGGFEIQARSGGTGSLMWTLPSDYALMPKSGANGYSWTPSYSPTLTPANRLYFAGLGGTVEYTTTPDASGPSAPATTRLAFFGLSNYNANPSAYNSTVYIDTPITTDASGDIFFGFLVTGSNPLGLTSGVARIGADGSGSYVSVVTGTTQVATNSAPALSNDGNTLYVLENSGNFGSGKLVALDSHTLAVDAKVTLMDPHNTTRTAVIANDGTSSPTVGPDGDVYIGVLENPFASNNDRGWLLHFSSDLSTAKVPGAFGWDDTAAIVPASMVPSYSGTSTYLLMTKYNNYAGEGGDGVNKLAILDPNAMMTDPVTGTTVMQEVLTIAGPTPDPEFDQTHPNAVREWCINTAAVDPATDSILANSEDGKLYRWDLATNTFTQKITLTSGVGEAYTPTIIGVDGTVYAINNATLFAVGANPATATFIGKNAPATNAGNWVGTYGADGYDALGYAANLPSYAAVTPANNTYYTWAASTTDTRALQNPANPTGSRVSACWYSTHNTASFTVDVDFIDGQSHSLALYLLDWPNSGRSETVQLSDAATGTVLNTQTVSSFGAGAYLRWTISGNVLITITKTAGSSAVLSGLFFDPPPVQATASFVGENAPATNAGNWVGTYGADGYDALGYAANLPSYASVTPANNTYYTWASSTTDTRALQNPANPTGSRVAACWYSTQNTASFTIDVNITDGQSHDLALYLLDWPNSGRSETVQLSDVATGTVLDTQSVSSFSRGVYLQWTISGNVLITITKTAGSSAVLSGLFFDPPPPPPAPGTATFVGENAPAANAGNWVGTYGADGYDALGYAANLPSYAAVTPANNTYYVWAASTTDTRALQNPANPTGSRVSAVWYSTNNTASFTVDVNITDGQSHNLALYLLDWPNSGRSETVQLSDATSGTVLDTQSVSSFSKGVYLQWTISGNVLITITKTAGSSAVLSGLFFDPMVSGASVPASLASVQFAGVLTPVASLREAPATRGDSFLAETDSSSTAGLRASSVPSVGVVARDLAAVDPAGKIADARAVSMSTSGPRPDGKPFQVSARRLARQARERARPLVLHRQRQQGPLSLPS